MKNNLIENKILNYNSFNYESEKINFSDYVNDKHNIIHKKIYDEALKEMIADKGYNVNNYNFIEIKQENYYEPSLVYVKSIYPPFNTEKISLKPYWNKYEYVEEHKDLDDMFLSDDINKDALEIISINYVNNTVKYKEYDKPIPECSWFYIYTDENGELHVNDNIADEATKEEWKHIDLASLQPSVHKVYKKYPQVDNDTYEKVIIKLNNEVAEQIKAEVNKNN